MVVILTYSYITTIIIKVKRSIISDSEVLVTECLVATVVIKCRNHALFSY